MAGFRLPVLKGGGAATEAELLRWALRGEAVFDATLGERVAAEWGEAIVSEEFPEIPGGNHVREVALPAGRTWEEVAGEVVGIFAERRLRCGSWVFADGRVPAEAQAVLEGKGYRLERGNLWALGQARGLRVREDLSVIPGRASFEKLAELFVQSHTFKSDREREQFAAATSRRLDDTQVENLLALDGTTAVGTIYLVTAGEAGFLTQFFVRPGFCRQGVGTTLLMAAMELAGRSRLKHLTLFCDAENRHAEALYRKAGFGVVMEVESLEARTLASEGGGG
jgi:ribosomal protein S18 acetylase RimI-like enzyme